MEELIEKIEKVKQGEHHVLLCDDVRVAQRLFLSEISGIPVDELRANKQVVIECVEKFKNDYDGSLIFKKTNVND